MDEVSSKLLVIFQNVNEWLRFAEAKNAVLLAFAGAGMTATITLLATAQNLPNSLRVGLLLTTSLLCICAFLCSLSFLPKTNLERLLLVQTKQAKNSNIQLNNTDNFYYFGHLYKYNPTQLLDMLNKHYFEEKLSIRYKKEYKDIASQITINSEITFIKFQIFTYALYSLIASIIVIPCSIIISLVIYKTL
ncbi:hypothetical protein I8748_31720 [Nostoc sp. CENA67]|uniref:Pycsar effector protein domain-containing protein n=1 Tax=Amazonocrinis nigriterrae CENA67 TaxID=2794033 RepID=A0A8J7I1N7_9NOST|nr:hypothetical protein [Amazonocrinis nigriterrae]MBH8566669.1 hypothetical protein [Amazonocrinis nigriterrae CENA67]